MERWGCFLPLLAIARNYQGQSFLVDIASKYQVMDFHTLPPDSNLCLSEDQG